MDCAVHGLDAQGLEMSVALWEGLCKTPWVSGFSGVVGVMYMWTPPPENFSKFMPINRVHLAPVAVGVLFDGVPRSKL